MHNPSSPYNKEEKKALAADRNAKIEEKQRLSLCASAANAAARHSKESSRKKKSRFYLYTRSVCAGVIRSVPGVRYDVRWLLRGGTCSVTSGVAILVIVPDGFHASISRSSKLEKRKFWSVG